MSSQESRVIGELLVMLVLERDRIGRLQQEIVEYKRNILSNNSLVCPKCNTMYNINDVEKYLQHVDVCEPDYDVIDVKSILETTV